MDQPYQKYQSTFRSRPFHREADIRSLWISDIHLGSRGCQAGDLLRFLKTTRAETIYLVGDVIDLWALRRRPYWPKSHMEVIRRLLAMAKNGTTVIYIPGNHDHYLRSYSGQSFGQILIRERAIHTTADGRRLLVMHGDEFDRVIHKFPWLAHAGDIIYDGLRLLNHWTPFFSSRTPHHDTIHPQTVSAKIKHWAKKLVHLLSHFESQVESFCRDSRTEGMICGHSHFAEISDFRGITYYNDGDWVESRTALIEHHDGTMELVQWPAMADNTESSATLWPVTIPKIFNND